VDSCCIKERNSSAEPNWEFVAPTPALAVAPTGVTLDLVGSRFEKFPVAKAAGLVEEEGEGKLGTLLLLGLLKLPASAVFCAGNRFNGMPPPSKGSLSELGEPKLSSEGACGVTAFGGGAALLFPGSGLKNLSSELLLPELLPVFWQPPVKPTSIPKAIRLSHWLFMRVIFAVFIDVMEGSLLLDSRSIATILPNITAFSDFVTILYLSGWE
jgi:hypothetical protein